jgi:hypothetical protein
MVDSPGMVSDSDLDLHSASPLTLIWAKSSNFLLGFNCPAYKMCLEINWAVMYLLKPSMKLFIFFYFLDYSRLVHNLQLCSQPQLSPKWPKLQVFFHFSLYQPVLDQQHSKLQGCD